MAESGDGRGVLYPARLPSLHREPAPREVSELVHWFWIPRWDLAPGRISRQELLPFPASNPVVQVGGVSLAGPTTGVSHRDLRGRGWAADLGYADHAHLSTDFRRVLGCAPSSYRRHPDHAPSEYAVEVQDEFVAEQGGHAVSEAIGGPQQRDDVPAQ
ncbi:helix-turn-helix domain-containing protein [Propionibacterium sp.]|uniref:helix-turn-helix domain-containing protein n=1 Tax=Propionibacterium sp. TaxID=1977903 RepID=UPI0039EC6A14